MTDVPSSHDRDLERRVYGPHPDADAVATLMAERARGVPGETVDDPQAAEPAVDPSPTRAVRRHPLLLPVAGFLALCAIAAVLAPRDERQAPVVVPRPTASEALGLGSDEDTLVAYSRPAQPGTLATTVTYQPNGYALVDPHGAALRAELTCAGAGVVRVNLTDGTRFRFDCDAQQRDLTQLSAGAHSSPFLVVAATTGNVVWDLKITAVRSLWRADLD